LAVDGCSATVAHAAQSYVWPLTAAKPASERGALHWSRSFTVVVERETMLNVALPAHVVLPSVVVPVIVIV
jgi:hypothetical protein